MLKQTKTMYSKLELMPLIVGSFASVLFEEIAIKCIATVVAMGLGTIASYYIKKFLEK